MSNDFSTQIAQALGPLDTPAAQITGGGALPSSFDVAGLATASVAAAAQELAAVMGTDDVVVDQRLAQMWFGMTLRPQGWTLPNPWDPIAGDYHTQGSWIRLHTNAPHHRAAALSVLGCPQTRAAVTEAVVKWRADALEDAILAAHGCAAALHTKAQWADHPQGKAVAQEPLIAWQQTSRAAPASGSGLRGLRVLDLTRVLAGPVATRFLAGFGADVLRIDPPGWAEPAVEQEVTLGKRCASLDLHNSADRQCFDGLLAEADVIVHGYRPGALERLGYGAAHRQQINPHLIDVSLCAYGWTGPWAGRRGFDSLVQMSSGIADGGEGANPTPLPVQALDHATGYLMAAAVLRALRLRRAQGQVLAARLSLARTAALLTSGGVRQPADSLLPETAQDLAATREITTWGAARRLQFPVMVEGNMPLWPHPAGALHTSAARWA